MTYDGPKDEWKQWHTHSNEIEFKVSFEVIHGNTQVIVLNAVINGNRYYDFDVCWVCVRLICEVFFLQFRTQIK